MTLNQVPSSIAAHYPKICCSTEHFFQNFGDFPRNFDGTDVFPAPRLVVTPKAITPAFLPAPSYPCTTLQHSLRHATGAPQPRIQRPENASAQEWAGLEPLPASAKARKLSCLCSPITTTYDRASVHVWASVPTPGYCPRGAPTICVDATGSAENTGLESRTCMP